MSSLRLGGDLERCGELCQWEFRGFTMVEARGSRSSEPATIEIEVSSLASSWINELRGYGDTEYKYQSNRAELKIEGLGERFKKGPHGESVE